MRLLLPASTSIVPYNPDAMAIQPYPLPCSKIGDLIRCALNHFAFAVSLRTFSEKRTIFILLGPCSSGKTTLLNIIEKTIPGALGLSMDDYGPHHDANRIKLAEPKLFARMAKALDINSIAYAVVGKKSLDRLYWKKECSREEREDVEAAVREARTELNGIHETAYDHVNKMAMDEIILSSKNRPFVAFDPFTPDSFFSYCSMRNFSLSHTTVIIGLPYCPFDELPTRVAKRNKGDNPLEYRNPTFPLMQFLDYYRPAKKGEFVIDILQRKKVEKSFEKAFRLEMSDLSKRAHTHPFQQRMKTLHTDHDKMKATVMKKLGFSNPKVQKVGITPKFQYLNYFFNTRFVKPTQIANFIRSKM